MSPRSHLAFICGYAPAIAYVIGAGRKIEHVSGFLWPLNNWPVLILNQTVTSSDKNENTFSLKGCHISYISENNLGKILGLAINISDLKCVTGPYYVISLISLKRHGGFENANTNSNCYSWYQKNSCWVYSRNFRLEKSLKKLAIFSSQPHA